uniref:Uncharacterized protein n=1 Tax=Gasterosteus aculeatus TaxID=69293 RepID=G3Q1N2_GASAC
CHYEPAQILWIGLSCFFFNNTAFFFYFFFFLNKNTSISITPNTAGPLHNLKKFGLYFVMMYSHDKSSIHTSTEQINKCVLNFVFSIFDFFPQK